MAKDILILDIKEASTGFVNIRFILWFPISAGFKNPNFTSSYPDITTDLNTTGQDAALRAGTVIEEIYTITIPMSWIANAWASVEAILLAFLTTRKNVRAGTLAALPDPGLKYAIMHDSGTGWSA